jgi:flagellar biosynthesis protein FlhG
MTSIRKPRVMSVTGGKGGIGKTTISINLACAFAKMNKKVMILDADFGLANVDVALGMKPNLNLYDVVTGKCSLSDACITGPYGIKVVPAASGIQKLAELGQVETAGLIKSFSELTEDIDIMIVDLASGISSQVMDFTHASQEVMIVICNDPSSFMDSYAVTKILHQKYGRDKFGVIVNKVKDMHEGYDVFTKFQSTISQFMSLSMNFIGYLPADDYLSMAARERVSVVDRYPSSPSSKQFQAICKSIEHWDSGNDINGGIQFFLERLLTVRAFA